MKKSDFKNSDNRYYPTTMKRNLTNHLWAFIAGVWMLFCAPAAMGQQFAIANDKSNCVYIGIDNPFSVVVANAGCDSLIVTTDNGTIAPAGNCHYIFRPTMAGSAQITVRQKNKSDTIMIGSMKFRTKPLPAPTLALSGAYDKDTISIHQIQASPYAVASLRGFDFDLRYNINSFQTIILRNDTSIFSEKNNGFKLSENLITFLSQCQTGDRLIICAAEVYGPNGKYKVAPVEYVLKQ